MSKVHINMAEGIIELEGDSDFVLEIYKDFRDDLISRITAKGLASASQATPASTPPLPAKPKKRAPQKKKINGETGTIGVNPDSPTLDKNLDTTGLQEFYGQFEPKNHPEKILVFLKFLIDHAGIESPNTDQVYTCYEAVKEKPAAAFAQAFRDTSSKKNGYIDYNSATDIKVTFIGNRHFDHELKRKVDE